MPVRPAPPPLPPAASRAPVGSAPRDAAAADPGAALLRGLRQSRDLPRLTVLRWLQDLVTFGLALGGLALPWLAVFGTDVLADLAPLMRARDIDALAEAVLDVWLAIEAAPRAAAAGSAGLALAWTAALAVYCWMQGGIWGLLTDRGVRFGRHAGRHFWGIFWLVNLFATALLGLVLLWMLAWVWLPRSPGGTPSWLALIVAGVLAVPAAVAAAGAALWYSLARAWLVRCSDGARAATRRGWRTLRRRPAPPILVSLLAAAGLVVLSSVLAPLSAVSIGLGETLDGRGAAVALQLVLLALQGLAAGWLAIVHAGAFVALAGPPPAPRPPDRRPPGSDAAPGADR